MTNKVSSYPAGRGCFGDASFAHTHTVVPAIIGARSHEQGILAGQNVLDLTGQSNRYFAASICKLPSSPL
jgi:hypothetical protein